VVVSRIGGKMTVLDMDAATLPADAKTLYETMAAH
jgi:hypothetical protein